MILVEIGTSVSPIRNQMALNHVAQKTDYALVGNVNLGLLIKYDDLCIYTVTIT